MASKMALGTVATLRVGSKEKQEQLQPQLQAAREEARARTDSHSSAASSASSAGGAPLPDALGTLRPEQNESKDTLVVNPWVSQASLRLSHNLSRLSSVQLSRMSSRKGSIPLSSQRRLGPTPSRASCPANAGGHAPALKRVSSEESGAPPTCSFTARIRRDGDGSFGLLMNGFGRIRERSAAATAAGVRCFDRVTEVDGVPVLTLRSIETAIARMGSATFTFERPPAVLHEAIAEHENAASTVLPYKQAGGATRRAAWL